MATRDMLPDAHDLMTCEHCQTPVILTVESSGLCPRCFYKLECEAICTAAEDEVDRVLTEGAFAAALEESTAPTIVYISPTTEPVWSW